MKRKPCRHPKPVWWITGYGDPSRIYWCLKCGAVRLIYSYGRNVWRLPGRER